MSTNHHTDIPIGAAANAITFNLPNGELDQAITDLLSGALPFGSVSFDAAVSLIISGGAVTPTQAFHLIDTEGAAATDNLDTITPSAEVSVLILRTLSAAREVVVRHGVDNIYLAGGEDLVLDSNDKALLLVRYGNDWFDVGAKPSTAPITQVEIDFGATPVSEATFTITDTLVTTGKPIMAALSMEAATGKAEDESEMESFAFSCRAGVGEFYLRAKSLEGRVANRFVVNYLVGMS